MQIQNCVGEPSFNSLACMDFEGSMRPKLTNIYTPCELVDKRQLWSDLIA